MQMPNFMKPEPTMPPNPYYHPNMMSFYQAPQPMNERRMKYIIRSVRTHMVNVMRNVMSRNRKDNIDDKVFTRTFLRLFDIHAHRVTGLW